MVARAHDMASPLAERFSLEDLINGMVADLAALRQGTISVEDARVRAEMTKQALNGVRLVVNAQKYLEQRARALPDAGSDAKRGDAS